MNESKRNNNEPNNNSNNNNIKGEIIMTNNTIKTMETFVSTVKVAIEAYYGEGYHVSINKVTKNNDCHLTGLTIMEEGCNLAPTIYLEGLYENYRNGKSMDKLCRDIIRIHEENKAKEDFDIEEIMNFEQIKDRICFKLVNRERNKELLQNTPHIIFLDLAIVFYVLVSKEADATASILVKDNLLESWGVKDTDKLFEFAKKNTQYLLRGTVSSMMEVMTEIICDDTNDLPSEFVDEFFDMSFDENNAMPMYVATNSVKLNGASVICYDGLLESFAEKIDGNFFILPSSTHEVIFVPDFGGFDAKELKAMVCEVNETQVDPDEILSNNVYRYNKRMDCVEML